MKLTLTDELKKEIFEEVRQFLAEELETDPGNITEHTNIIDDLGGDSILFIELIEELKEKYQIDLEVRTIGQYMLKNPVFTLGETVNAIFEIIEKGEDLIENFEEQEEKVEEHAA